MADLPKTAYHYRLHRSWLVDAGFPTYCALPLDPEATTTHATPLLRYTVRPVAPGRYVISGEPHPRPYLFDLIDTPVDEATYRAATTNDYGPHGLFLDRLVINKVIGDAKWRFDSAATATYLEQFRDGERFEHPLEGDPAAAIGAHFGIPPQLVAAALAQLRPS